MDLCNSNHVVQGSAIHRIFYMKMCIDILYITKMIKKKKHACSPCITPGTINLDLNLLGSEKM